MLRIFYIMRSKLDRHWPIRTEFKNCWFFRFGAVWSTLNTGEVSFSDVLFCMDGHFGGVVDIKYYGCTSDQRMGLQLAFERVR